MNVHIRSASSPKSKVEAVRRPGDRWPAPRQNALSGSRTSLLFADRQVVEVVDVKTGAATAQDTTGKRPDTDPDPGS
ncbi:hypothetical protein OIE50_49410 [Streptomyces canus]|uniref:hypothetical protein n=1 Tax=Streptomyces canus TaxID=58343 RepID=UPI003250AFC3